MILPKFEVAILCMTYQHAPYIEDALNGFCMQQTSFPFVVAVVDDASTDGEQERISLYLKKHFDLSSKNAYFEDAEEGVYTFAQHITNKNCYLLSLNLKKNLFKQKGAKSKLIARWIDKATYIAECEGDDYWTDPYKLQKQVDYMESHPDCSCYAHNSITLNTQTRQIGLFNKKILDASDYTLETFLKMGWFTPTQSLLYRQSDYHHFNDIPPMKQGDYSLLVNLLLAPDTYLHYENEIMSVYRDGGYASTHYKELDLIDSFITLLKYYKEKSNHRCDAIFDRLIEREEIERNQVYIYQRDCKKSRSIFVRMNHWLSRVFANIANRYVPCIQVTKRVERPQLPNIEELQ